MSEPSIEEMQSDTCPIEDPRWSCWTYGRGQWVGPWVYFGNAEGCTRTLVIATKWTGGVVFGLWRMRFDPDCPECLEARR